MTGDMSQTPHGRLSNGNPAFLAPRLSYPGFPCQRVELLKIPRDPEFPQGKYGQPWGVGCAGLAPLRFRCFWSRHWPLACPLNSPVSGHTFYSPPPLPCYPKTHLKMLKPNLRAPIAAWLPAVGIPTLHLVHIEAMRSLPHSRREREPTVI